MPFIDARFSTPVDKAKEEVIKSRLGKTMSLIGKSESWLMLNFEDNCRLYFKGDSSKDMAILEVALFGKATDSQYDALTEELTNNISSVLNIDPSCIYVKYEEVDHWGYNGFNF